MRIQLWSYNYDPEPSGIAPLSSSWARAMKERGHHVVVVAAHPHYPKPVWGTRLRPYRERRGDISVVRLPLWIGRDSGIQRVRQELSYALSLTGAASVLPTCDVVVAVSPSFPGLLPAMAWSRLRRTPWVMWLQDVLPEGAATTGLIPPGPWLEVAKRFELAAYKSADRVIVISDAFERNLCDKGVPASKTVRVYNPSPVAIATFREPDLTRRPRRLLVMGNIGHTQGLAPIVRTLQDSTVLNDCDAELRIVGHGVAADAVRSEINSDRVKMVGLLFGNDMEAELSTASVGLVTQRADVSEFNLPSKLMNYMAHGVPVLAVVNRDSETARIVRDSESGWIVPSDELERLPAAIREILLATDEVKRRGRRAHETARVEFAPERIAEQFESVLDEVRSRRTGRASASMRT